MARQFQPNEESNGPPGRAVPVHPFLFCLWRVSALTILKQHCIIMSLQTWMVFGCLEEKVSYVFPGDLATLFCFNSSWYFTKQESDSVCLSVSVLGTGKVMKVFLSFTTLHTNWMLLQTLCPGRHCVCIPSICLTALWDVLSQSGVSKPLGTGQFFSHL